MPGPQAEQQVADALRRLAGGVLEGGQLLDLVDDAKAVGRVDHEVRRVPDAPGGPDEPPQLVDEVGRRLDPLRAWRTPSSR